MTNNYWELEKELEAKLGREKLDEALAQLEEEYGTNGLDAYKSGDFHLLLDLLES
jgi:hypothetical protein